MAAIASAPVHLHALHINDRIFRNIPQSANGLSDDAVVCRDFDMPILSRRETCAFKASPDWQYEELGVKRGVLTSATECTEVCIMCEASLSSSPILFFLSLLSFNFRSRSFQMAIHVLRV